MRSRPTLLRACDPWVGRLLTDPVQVPAARTPRFPFRVDAAAGFRKANLNAGVISSIRTT
jgi:hypothetical protein